MTCHKFKDDTALSVLCSYENFRLTFVTNSCSRSPTYCRKLRIFPSFQKCKHFSFEIDTLYRIDKVIPQCIYTHTMSSLTDVNNLYCNVFCLCKILKDRRCCLYLKSYETGHILQFEIKATYPLP